MNHRLQFVRFVCLGVSIACAACSSSKKTDEPGGATVSGLNRFMDKGFDKKSGQFDRNIVSQFDQRRYGGGRKFKEDSFHTESFAGKHDYKGADDFKAKEFSQSGKTSREASQEYSRADKAPREADQKFASKDSGYDDQKARQGGQEFSGDDKSFKTGEVRDAAKSQKKNTRPEIIPKDETEDGKSVYSEAEVKRLVNRN